jgi:hypothetical protein
MYWICRYLVKIAGGDGVPQASPIFNHTARIGVAIAISATASLIDGTGTQSPTAPFGVSCFRRLLYPTVPWLSRVTLFLGIFFQAQFAYWR